MNAISDSFAFCLYPKSTIDLRVSYFFTDPLSTTTDNIVTKYSARGYSFRSPPLLSTILHDSEWTAIQPRSLRDIHTLAIPLKCLHSKTPSAFHLLGCMSWVNDFRNPLYCTAVFDLFHPNGETEGFVMAPLQSVRASQSLQFLPDFHGLSGGSRHLRQRCVSSVFSLGLNDWIHLLVLLKQFTHWIVHMLSAVIYLLTWKRFGTCLLTLSICSRISFLHSKKAWTFLSLWVFVYVRLYVIYNSSSRISLNFLSLCMLNFHLFYISFLFYLLCRLCLRVLCRHVRL